MAVLSLIAKAIPLVVVFIFSRYVLAYLQSPLKKLPGPFLARFSNIWRFFDHYSQTHIETQRKLHEQHGDIVRLGPTTVSVADASLIKTIYNTRGTFLKSDYYRCVCYLKVESQILMRRSINDAPQDGHIIQNMFSTRSNEYHSKTVRPVQRLYSHQNVLQLEDLMDNDLSMLCTQLESRFMKGVNKNKTCDIADWISFFAWDFLGHCTWSKRIGFMEEAKDVGDMLGTAERVMRYFSVVCKTLVRIALPHWHYQVGQIPVLDRWLGKNPMWPRSIYKFDDFAVAAGFAVERFKERMQDPALNKGTNDFLNGFLEAKKEYPNLVTDNEVIGYMIINVCITSLYRPFLWVGLTVSQILGGADTLAIVMKGIFYHLLKTPSALRKLTTELRAAKLQYPTSYSSVEKLPYLAACIQEGLRMHPVIGHILERIVPSSGLTLPDGTILPPGTIVGVNPWVIHYQEKIFGAKPHEFRPERWLQGAQESAASFEARFKGMKDADMAFGGGNRACIGRPIALVETYKVVATVFGKYDVSGSSPDILELMANGSKG
jgi:hypothetical protein